MSRSVRGIGCVAPSIAVAGSGASPDPPPWPPGSRWGRATGHLRTACCGPRWPAAVRGPRRWRRFNRQKVAGCFATRCAGRPANILSIDPCSPSAMALRDGRPQAPRGPGPACETLATSAAHRSGEASNGTYPAIEGSTHPLPFAPPRVGAREESLVCVPQSFNQRSEPKALTHCGASNAHDIRLCHLVRCRPAVGPRSVDAA